MHEFFQPELNSYKNYITNGKQNNAKLKNLKEFLTLDIKLPGSE